MVDLIKGSDSWEKKWDLRLMSRQSDWWSIWHESSPIYHGALRFLMTHWWRRCERCVKQLYQKAAARASASSVRAGSRIHHFGFSLPTPSHRQNLIRARTRIHTPIQADLFPFVRGFLFLLTSKYIRQDLDVYPGWYRAVCAGERIIAVTFTLHGFPRVPERL